MLRLFALFLCALSIAAGQENPSFDDLAKKAADARDANNIPNAIELYRRALQMKPDWNEGWWYLGSLLYDSDRYLDAAAALKHVVDADPRVTPAWALLGLSQFETGAYDESLANITRALSPASNLPPQMEAVLRFHQALLLTRAGDFEKAVQSYAWFAHKGAIQPDVLQAIGLAALHSPILLKDIPAGQRELYSLAGRAAYLVMSGDYAQAQQAFAQLLQHYPRSPYVHYLYGTFLMAASPDEALQELQRELELTPENGYADAMLAWLLTERGDTEAALPCAQRAVKLLPKLPLAQFVLGRALASKGDLSTAIQHLEVAEKLDPASVDDHIALATAYSRAGRLEDSRRERRISLNLAKESTALAQHP
ncbi:MAG: tetratricopeptide repeat protein [Acidobacteriaceae bacterium]|nr:tetratricopeptide repeat protein [Acidobacteriaceae bacterium]